MKRKLLTIIPILVIMAIVVLILILTRDKKPDFTLLEGTSYPVGGRYDGEDLILTPDGRESLGLEWSAVAENGSVVEISKKGKEKQGTAKFVLSPKSQGVTRVTLKRSGEVAGVSCEVALIYINVIVDTKADAEDLAVTCDQAAELVYGSEIGGEKTEYPYLLTNTGEGKAEITFLKGQNDWIFLDPDNRVSVNDMANEEGKEQLAIEMIPEAVSPGGGELEVNEEAREREVVRATTEINGVMYEYFSEVDTSTGTEATESKDSTESTEAKTTETVKEIGESTELQALLDKYRGCSSKSEDGSIRTVLVANSRSLGVTEFVDVTVYSDGRIRITEGKEPDIRGE